MKKLRVLLATAMMASAFTVVSAGPAHASCSGELADVCTTMCEIGLRNKLTAPAFQWCYIAR